MGYDLYITGGASRDSNEGFEIGESEWTELIATDPELVPHPELGPLAAVWTGVSEAELPWLVWEAGNVYTKNPDERLIAKMVEAGRAPRCRHPG
ncbi:MAG: hypothetical protein ACRD3V_28650 [Vicinamibacteria bacterium]